LTVLSPGASPREVTVTRQAIDIVPGRLVAVYDPTVGVGYIRFPRIINTDISSQLLDRVSEIRGQVGFRGLVLDLRIATSSGGNFPLGDLLTLFSSGPMGQVYTIDTADDLVITGQNYLDSQTFPLAILIGPDTTGFPEILAASLQEKGRAILVGLPTVGEIEGTTSVDLPNGSMLQLPTSTFRTQGGTEVGLVGVQPDLLIDSDWDAVQDGDDAVLNAAAAALLSGRANQ